MVQRAPPQIFRQPAGSAKCWAYALSSWMGATPDRRATSPETIIHACRSFCVFGSDALNPKFIDRVLESQFIRMGWKVIDGADLELAEIDILLRLGYIYVIADVKRGPLAFGAPPPSHARVIYKNTDPGLVASGAAPSVLGVIDPILGDATWTLSEVASFKLILGFQQEALADTAGKPPFHQWHAKVQGTEQNRFTPSPP